MPNLDTAGASLHYARTGQGPPVLLIQGVGAIGNAWRPQIEALSDRYTLVSFDNRGIGGSAIRDGRFTIDAMAADALAIMDAEGVDRFHVAGHSMGGVIAQALALARAGTGEEPGVPLHLCPGQGRIERSRCRCSEPPCGCGSARALMRRNAFLELIMPERYLQQVDRARLAAELQPLFGHDLADQPPIVMKQLKAMSRFDAGARLNELAYIPTLVVSAVEDRIAGRSTGRALATAIPGARYVEIADAGHGLPIHRAVETNALLDDHWSRAEGHVAAGHVIRPLERTATPDPAATIVERNGRGPGSGRSRSDALLGFDAEASDHPGDDVVHHGSDRSANRAEDAVENRQNDDRAHAEQPTEPPRRRIVVRRADARRRPGKTTPRSRRK